MFVEINDIKSVHVLEILQQSFTCLDVSVFDDHLTRVDLIESQRVQ